LRAPFFFLALAPSRGEGKGEGTLRAEMMLGRREVLVKK
jgi:hypothetical protein